MNAPFAHQPARSVAHDLIQRVRKTRNVYDLMVYDLIELAHLLRDGDLRHVDEADRLRWTTDYDAAMDASVVVECVLSDAGFMVSRDTGKATLTWLRIGGLTLDRTDAILAVTEEKVASLEADAARDCPVECMS
jgi:hypothetical protein